MYRDVLRARPDHPEALHYLGVVCKQTGNPSEAFRLIGKSISLNPGSAEAHFNLAVILHQQQRLEEAVAGYQRAVSLDPGYATALSNLGGALQGLGRLEEAVACIERALALKPDYAGAHNNLGNALRRQGRLKEAAASFEKALSLNPDSADVRINLGNVYLELDRPEEAAASFEHILSLNPGHAEAHNNLGVVLTKMDRLEEAVACIERALSLHGDYAEAHCNLGVAYGELGRTEEAVACLERALSLKPDHAEAFFNLAYVLERTNRVEEARTAVDRGLAILPGDLGINLIAAKLDRRAGRVKEGLDRLSRIELPAGVSTNMVQERCHELALLHDRNNDAERAFPLFLECNRVTSRTWHGRRFERDSLHGYIEVHLRRFTKKWIRSWSPPAPDEGAPRPVFLVGFPRSGTTLVGQVLDCHPKLGVVDEMPMVSTVVKRLEESHRDYPGVLARLSADDVAALKKLYYECADPFVDRNAGARLVDKMPLNLTNAGIIHRLFPTAKFILVLRHPCDVCLSCFMQWFKVNDAMAHFFTIEDTAKLYVKAMSLWTLYERLLPLSVHVVRYEALVEDFDAEIGQLLDFVGVGWDDSVRDFADNAAAGKKINTASYSQVTEKIYTRAKYRWQRYRNQLSPILDELAPFARDFGYGDPSPAAGTRR